MKPVNQDEINILKEIVSQKGKSIEKLDIMKILKKRDSERMKFFRGMTFEANEIRIPIDRLKDLIELNVLDYTSEAKGEMCITAKGDLILKYNLLIESNSVNDLLDHINQTFYGDFLKKANNTLNFEEKCALITLMGLLSFTKNYSINIALLREKEDIAINKCLGTVGESLSSMLGVENTLSEKLSHSGTEGKSAVTFFRRLDDIQLKTDSIYVKSGGGSHYLDLVSSQGIDPGKLSFLLRRIFDHKPLDFKERIAFVELLKEIEEDRIAILGNSTDFNVNDIKSNLSYNIKAYK
jgi:hypothetical protein